MKWTNTWQECPVAGQEVVVMVVLRDNTFKHDVATYDGDGKFRPRFWTDSPVVAWAELPHGVTDT